jgi:hypothetical protein
LEKTLKHLPDTLCGIYDRFLNVIEDRYWDYVEAALRWILFSVTKVTLKQLADAIAFDYSNGVQYTYMPDRQESNSDAICNWLEGLVDISPAFNPAVTLAHASVQDYLLNKHTVTKFSRDFSGESLSHSFIARTCITYLLYFETHPLEGGKYPLGEYAARYWCHHLLRCHDRGVILDVAMRLLEDGSSQYRALTQLRQGVQPFSYGYPYPVELPLHFCCLEGYIEGVQSLLANHPNLNWIDSRGSTAIMIAASNGHTDIIRTLIAQGAKINLPGEYYASCSSTALISTYQVPGLRWRGHRGSATLKWCNSCLKRGQISTDEICI